MKKEEVYIDLSYLSDHEKVKVKELTGLDFINGNYLHYLEGDNPRWLVFGQMSGDFNKVEVSYDQFIKIITPEPLSWYKKLLNKIKPKEKIVIDVNKITSYILLFVALSHLNKGFNPFEWSKTGLAITAIIYLFYTKNSDKCSN